MLNEQKNKELELAWEYVQKTKVNIFLTGRAGTGKTTFLKRLIKESPKNHIVVAPTGVAALNASGVTIHSFFQLPFGVTLPEYVRKEGDSGVERFRFNKAKISIIRSLELIIIDEISMVRADMLDAIDGVLRRIRHSTKPFGGVQMLMIGDVQQLAPVAKEDEWNILKEHYNSTFFFESKALKESGYVYIELKRIYRQTEGEFINLLEKVRTNSLNSNDLSLINKRYIENFAPTNEEGYITLCTHNYSAQQINDVKMQEINAPTYTFTAEVSGDFPEYMFPTNKNLSLKKGAQVMFTKNDISPDKKFVNGTIGIITNISKESIEVEPLDNQGEKIFVEQQEWENQTYDINPETKEITSKIVGMFKQYPLKLAWAITIHKSQGLTFDKAIIDASRSFTHGQVYVALSRCRTLEGLVLKTPIRFNSIINDNIVSEYNITSKEKFPTITQMEIDKMNYFKDCVLELFNFSDLERIMRLLKGFIMDNLSTLYPSLYEKWKYGYTQAGGEIFDVALKFEKQIHNSIGEDYINNKFLRERCLKGGEYFSEKMVSYIAPLLPSLAGVELDNKLNAKKLKDLYKNFVEYAFLKIKLIEHFSKKEFELEEYLKTKAKFIVDMGELRITKKGVKNLVHTNSNDKKSEEKEKSATQDDTPDILNKELFNKLRSWRYEKAKAAGLPAYCILGQKGLIGICNNPPKTEAELLAIKGIGKKFIEKYGAEILQLTLL